MVNLGEISRVLSQGTDMNNSQEIDYKGGYYENNIKLGMGSNELSNYLEIGCQLDGRKEWWSMTL